MMRPSLTLIVSSIFLAFILNAIYSMVLLYQPPTCIPGEICYHSLLNTKPKLDLILFTSESIRGKAELLILDKKSFNYNEHFEQDITVEISRNTRSNGTLYIHALIVPPLSRLNHYSSKPFLNELRRLSDVTHMYAPLTKFTIPKSRTFNLMKDESIKDHNNVNVKPTTHLMTKFAVMMANTKLSIPYSNIPPELVRFLRINSREQFLPIITEDILQSRINDLVEIMPDSTQMNFTFAYDPCSIGKLKFMVQMEATLINFLRLGFTDKDMDEIKGVFADTNLYLLCLTLFIASIHLLLDFLSFKNDVSFWRANKSMAGLSSRTVIWRVCSQTVIFFYLLDEGTSLLILIPSGIGNVIEFWKLKKVFKMTIGWRGIKINNKQNETDAEARTRKYDDESMRYLSYLLYPLCFCGAVYSLLYQPHKSWYSWTLNSLVNGVYLFGFLFMLPQLFVNYRLKSVAALPWRAFTYKAFNTFIDDIFAFIITMPTSHRIACFRDDIVFLVYLYQRWLYPVDKSRVDVGTGDPIVTEETDKKND